MSSEYADDIQIKMYNFIVNCMKTEKMPPTNREIGIAMQLQSTGHVDYHLTMLEKKGLISRQPKKSRGIKLLKTVTGIPVMGSIVDGHPLEIFSDPEQMLDIGHEMEHYNTYALIVKGRSMIKDHIGDGDYVVIKPQESCDNGDIVVAVHLQDGMRGSATLKRFFQEKDHDRVRLQPANSELEPILIPKSEWDEEWRVQGKVIAIFRQYGTKDEITTSQLPDLDNNIAVDTEDPIQDMKEASKAMREASAKLSELIYQRNVDLLHSELVPDKREGKDEGTKPLSDEELKPVVTNRDEEIVKTARTVIDLAAHQEAAYGRITAAAKNTREQLNQIYEQGQSQAKHWFRFGLTAAIIGFFVILIGAVIAMLSNNVAGVLTSISSIIPSTIAVLFFQQAKEANKRLDDFYGKLIEVEDLNRAVELSLTISDEVQDRYKGLIIFRLLGLHTDGQEIPILDLLTNSQEVHRPTLVKETSKDIK